MINDARLPELSHPLLKDAMTKLGCDKVEIVNIEPRPYAKINECHSNVQRQVSWYGGEKITGYYIAISKSKCEWVAIKHSVWMNDNKFIDVTPIDDERTCNVFIYGVDNLHTSVYNKENGEIEIDDTIQYTQTS